MRYVSLFAGIGGFDLAVDRLGGECVLQVEIDPFCQSVLDARWPEVPKAGDVREVDGSALECDLIVGGFPCQPVSAAGRKLAQEDPRWLWPQFARIIRESRPALVFIENVPGLHHRGLDDVLHDLSSLGYGGAWDFVSAWDAGAPHLRKRLWILAVRGRSGFEGRTRTAQPPPKGSPSRVLDSGWDGLFPTPSRADGTGGPGTSLSRAGGLNLRTHAAMWPTPSAASYGSNQGGAAGRVGPVRYGLEYMARHDLWPTHDANLGNGGRVRRNVDAAGYTEDGQKRQRTLNEAVRWPTPSGRDYKDTGDSIQSGVVPVNGLLGRAVGPSIEGGALSPDWVEWLMGFPVGWTAPSLTGEDLRAYDWSQEPAIPRIARGVSQRRQRLTALGNAVVPDSAIFAFRHLAARLNLDTSAPQWFTLVSGASRADGKVRHKMADKTRIDLAQHAIAEIAGKGASVRGGGSGWTAGINLRSGEIIRKSQTKAGALEAVLIELRKVTGQVVSANKCLCGCGGTTARRFVPGHDARYHLQLRATEAGYMSVSLFREHLKAESKKRAAQKRAAKRVAIKAGAAKIEAAAKAGTLAPGSKPTVGEAIVAIVDAALA